VARSRDERPEYVVELEVAGVAVLTVRADSADEACAKAEAAVRPVDVIELAAVESARVAGSSRRPPRPASAAEPELVSRPLRQGSMAGRHDQAARRRATRGGRRRGCYVYIAAEQLAEAGIDPSGPAPWYRIWTARGRPRFVVNLYREP
jgi:hypothetical protein